MNYSDGDHIVTSKKLEIGIYDDFDSNNHVDIIIEETVKKSSLEDNPMIIGIDTLAPDTSDKTIDLIKLQVNENKTADLK